MIIDMEVKKTLSGIQLYIVSTLALLSITAAFILILMFGFVFLIIAAVGLPVLFGVLYLLGKKRARQHPQQADYIETEYEVVHEEDVKK
jgi:hypothetical protein